MPADPPQDHFLNEHAFVNLHEQFFHDAATRIRIEKTDSASETTRITRSTRSDSSTVSFSRRERRSWSVQRNDCRINLRALEAKRNQPIDDRGREFPFDETQHFRLGRRRLQTEPLTNLEVGHVHIGKMFCAPDRRDSARDVLIKSPKEAKRHAAR
jgi:hypothetical protein